ncbi:MAG: hypothetical protein PHR24_07335 [Oscillospiraceae bacterium]|nr:hypothetical protein [Oscillospiraceae bacterium]MDD4547092.1 hypothetical protein [Oscillospiraceae bacterium]
MLSRFAGRVFTRPAHLILLSSKNQDIFAVCFPPYSVVVVGGRQPALLLRLILISD